MGCEESREGNAESYRRAKHNELGVTDAERKSGNDQPEAACHGGREEGSGCVSFFASRGTFLLNNVDVGHRGEYRKAFFACRKHRIGLNAIVEHERERFLANARSFVEQVNEVDHLNLFLTNLG